MAVLALGFVGEAIGASIGGTILGVAASSIGGFIGSAIGSMIDNMLFPIKQSGPRLDDLSVQASTYGNAIPYVRGPENRLAGNVIWSTGLLETVHKEHQGKGGPSVDTTTYTYRASCAVAIADAAKRGPIVGVEKIWANKKLIYDASVSTGPLSDPVDAKSAALWSSMTVYPGTFTQNPDPTIESYKGVGNVPGYRGTAYVVLADFQLADYGNRLPSFEFLLKADETATIAEVLCDICDLCGLDSKRVSTSSVEGLLRGYQIGTAASGTGTLQPLALAFDFDSASVGGAMRFVSRGAGPRATIPKDWLSCHQQGEDRPDPLAWTLAPITQLPREAAITFSDPARDYQPNTQTARRQTGSSQNNLSTSLPLVVDATTGRKIADRSLWEAWTGQATAQANIDDKLIGVEAGYVYAVKTPAGFEAIRVKQKTRGANGVAELLLARDRAEVYQGSSSGISAPVPVQTVSVPGPSEIVLIDGPILQDADDDTGFYYLVDGQSSSWRGADVRRSTDGGDSYDEVEPVGIEAVIGTIDAMGDGVTAVFDQETVVRVTLFDETDELASVTELELLNGANVFWIGPSSGEGGEIAQAMTAALVSPGVYDLSNWLRGRLGTEFATGTHNPGDLIAFLEPGSTRRADFSPSDWNKDRVYKAVSLLTDEADATPVDFTNTGEGKRPLSPVHVESSTDPISGDMTITWLRRSRYRQPGIGNGPLALGESSEAYEIDVFDGATFKRTLTSSSESVSYPSATLAADGFTAGETVTVDVYQISDVRGRGRPAQARLTL